MDAKRVCTLPHSWAVQKLSSSPDIPAPCCCHTHTKRSVSRTRGCRRCGGLCRGHVQRLHVAFLTRPNLTEAMQRLHVGFLMHAINLPPRPPPHPPLFAGPLSPGAIPESLGQLVCLEELFLHGNSLSGEIPPSLGNLKSLRKLFLNSNDLVGPVPHELGRLSSLDTLNLSWNNLQGEVPASVKALVREKRREVEVRAGGGKKKACKRVGNHFFVGVVLLLPRCSGVSCGRWRRVQNGQAAVAALVERGSGPCVRRTRAGFCHRHVFHRCQVVHWRR